MIEAGQTPQGDDGEADAAVERERLRELIHRERGLLAAIAVELGVHRNTARGRIIDAGLWEVVELERQGRRGTFDSALAARAVKAARLARGWSQAKLGAECSPPLPQSRVTMHERTRGRRVTAEMFARYAAALKTTPETLLSAQRRREARQPRAPSPSRQAPMPAAPSSDPREHLAALLRKHQGNVAAIGAALGITRQAVGCRIARAGLTAELERARASAK